VISMSPLPSPISIILAATETTPSEWSDLSALLEVLRDPVRILDQAAHVEGREGDLLQYIRQSIDLGRIAHWDHRLTELLTPDSGIQAMSVADSDYPELLKQCFDRPPFLFVKGAVVPVDEKSIAIVGSRDAIPEARAAAYDLASSAAAAGLTVISGLARGVDASAHRGALDHGGRTVAVIASGIDYRTYPPEHRQLEDQICSAGAVVSQFRPGSPPTRSSFVSRNAIISGLSRASFVIQGGQASGTRTEAEAAQRHGRPVYLWRPILGMQPWALRLACEPGVELTSDWSDAIEAVRSAEPA
jgi:DNA processing protein